MTRHELFAGDFGYADPIRFRDPARARAIDLALDAALSACASPPEPPGRAIVVLVPSDPARPQAVAPIVAELERCRHRIEVRVDDRALWRSVKLNEAAAAASGRDWLLVCDDDVALPPGFVDRFIATAEAAGFLLAQPAHRMHSYASYAVTQRRAASLARRTCYVEIGPVVAIRAGLSRTILPVPETMHGWGVDILWADRARREGWPIGVIDATPIEHLRPLDRATFPAALADASRLLHQAAPAIDRQTLLGPGRVVIGC
ncbi:glycosyltransferase family 2 protein [Sphingomonas profundi]|uniref:glycosyltransferase family 2 protein n=1 Tax=Alterirhizorhabdus profundi TaxID=2681549 RepID=UPI0018D0D735|nr:glycosyltransferase [Sphingomonas profundi]